MTTGEDLQIVNDPAPVATPTDDAALGAVFDRMVTNNGADRGEGGKFVSPAAAEGAQGGSPEGEGAADAQPSPVVGVAAPAHLLGAIKAKWDTFSEDDRAAIIAYQAEQDRKFGDLGKQLQSAKPIADKIMGAAQQYEAFKGLTPDQIVEGAISLAGVQAALAKSPESAVSMIMEVAKSYNVLPQLAKVFGGQEGGNDNQLVTGLQQKIANLEAQIAKAGNPETIREHITATMTERETETAVRSFAKGKDFWTDVEAHMPRFIQVVQGDEASAGKSVEEILTEAYDMAINALPDVRAKVRATEAKATAAQPDPKRTEAAKKAASINVPSAPSGKERVLTDDELLDHAYTRAMAN